LLVKLCYYPFLLAIAAAATMTYVSARGKVNSKITWNTNIELLPMRIMIIRFFENLFFLAENRTVLEFHNIHNSKIGAFMQLIGIGSDSRKMVFIDGKQ
jgi:hypothetical protein